MGNGTTANSETTKWSLITRIAEWLLQQGSAVVVSVSFLGAVIYGATWALPYTITEFKSIQNDAITRFEKTAKQQQEYDRERFERQQSHHEQIVRMILEKRTEALSGK